MKVLKKKNEEQDPTQPLEESGSEVDNQQDDVESADSVSAEEDRSAFNCDACSGEGLTYHIGLNRHERCAKCGGTGKVN